MIKKIALLFIALALNVSSIFASPIQYPISSYLKRTYLEMIKIKEIAPKEILHIVLGNQSGDMDSIASAIAFSYANRSRGFYIPVINIPKEDLALRGDVLHVFKTLHIDPNFLFYKEDLNFLLSLAKQGYLRVTLVDHNRLSPDQESFKDYIEKIIDHHKEENNFYPLMKEEDKMILKIGFELLVGDRVRRTALSSVPPKRD